MNGNCWITTGCAEKKINQNWQHFLKNKTEHLQSKILEDRFSKQQTQKVQELLIRAGFHQCNWSGSYTIKMKKYKFQGVLTRKQKAVWTKSSKHVFAVLTGSMMPQYSGKPTFSKQYSFWSFFWWHTLFPVYDNSPDCH